MSMATEAPPEEVRIVVERNGPISSISYLGEDPETRYRPREISAWAKIKENIRLGFARPRNFYRSL